MPSKAYDAAVAAAAAHHASSKTYSGKFLRPHKPVLSAIVARLGITSVLDYGAGKGAQYSWVDPADGKTLEQAWGFEVTKYDPAWPPYAAEPAGAFGLVICTHVLGSIPTRDLKWAFGRLFGCATKAVYLAEKIGPVQKAALAAVAGRPDNWSSEQWLEAVAPFAAAFKGETHFSFRHRDGDGVHIDRHRCVGGAWSHESNRV